MANYIDSNHYALGIQPPPEMRKKKTKSDKNKKPISKFKEVLTSIISNQDSKTESSDDIFEQIKDLPQEEAVSLLQDAVRSSGDTLKNHQNPQTILAYKQSVKNFITYVTQKSYTVTTKKFIARGKNNQLKKHAFTQIQIINEKLDKFAGELLYDQKSQLFILEKLEEIRGLLVDLIT